jgi:hypothetical protein
MLQNLFGSWLAGVAKNDKAHIQVGVCCTLGHLKCEKQLYFN